MCLYVNLYSTGPTKLSHKNDLYAIDFIAAAIVVVRTKSVVLFI